MGAPLIETAHKGLALPVASTLETVILRGQAHQQLRQLPLLVPHRDPQDVV